MPDTPHGPRAGAGSAKGTNTVVLCGLLYRRWAPAAVEKFLICSITDSRPCPMGTGLNCLSLRFRKLYSNKGIVPAATACDGTGSPQLGVAGLRTAYLTKPIDLAERNQAINCDLPECAGRVRPKGGGGSPSGIRIRLQISTASEETYASGFNVPSLPFHPWPVGWIAHREPV